MSDTITITGNIATDPELKRTPAGVAITTFRVASTQRRFDRATGQWIDGGTNWYTVSTFRSLADHAFHSLRKGHRVLLTGRLRLRQWDTGVKQGTSIEIEADAIGHDLLWGTTRFEKDAPPTTTVPVEGDPWAAPAEGEAATTGDWGAREGDAPRELALAGTETPF